MEKAEIIQLLLELYSARKEAQEYLDFFAVPNEQWKVEEYKRIIRKEFYPARNSDPKLRFSVCRKAISDFKKLKPSPVAMAELMVSYMEYACRFAGEMGDLWEQYYASVEGNFERTLVFLHKNSLWVQFDVRIRQCLHYVANCGWGFPDTLWAYYNQLAPWTDAEVVDGGE